MYLKEYFPFYTTYANPLLYEGERMQDKEFNLMKSYYPGTVQHIQEKIEEECDLMDYEGSRLYDEYPDRMTLYKMAQDIYAVLEQEEKREQAEAAAVAAAPADGGEVSTTGDRISAGAAMNPAVRTAETAPLLGPESMELIQVLLYGEIFRRRQKRGFRKF